jgi:hypothetical protein
MTENDTLHLWFKPYGGVMGDGDVAFAERYGRRFYPKAMGELAKQLHKLVAKISKTCNKGTFEYMLQHYTRAVTKRYIIQESLRDVVDPNGLSIGIQPTTPEERKLFSQCFHEGANQNTTPILNVIAYLEDTLCNEAHKWENAKMKDGQEALPVLLDIIEFLKGIKNVARVYAFEIEQTPIGHVLTLALVTPGVLSYYTRIDWTIV